MAMLCEQGDNRGIGYDPSHDPGRTAAVASGRVTIVAEPYPADRPVEGRLVYSRHVFEHLTDPVAVLSGIRRSIDRRDDVVLYLEVPDATYMLEAPAAWDLIYEHPLYWTEATLRTTARRCGFSPVASGRSFADQYLWVDARAGVVDADSFPSTDDLERSRAASAGFGSEVRGLVDRWNVRLSELTERGPVAMWGAGSKGVSFLSLIDDPGLVTAVVDLNPHKHGRFTPVGGSPVIAPDTLDSGTAVVLVTNPLYLDEVRNDLVDAGDWRRGGVGRLTRSLPQIRRTMRSTTPGMSRFNESLLSVETVSRTSPFRTKRLPPTAVAASASVASASVATSSGTSTAAGSAATSAISSSPSNPASGSLRRTTTSTKAGTSSSR